MKRSKWLVKAGLLLVMAVLLTVALRSGREIVERLDEYAEARSEYAYLREIAGVGHNAYPAPCAENESGVTLVDFDALFAINPRTVGWITLPDSTISYSIVQGSDNRHYLHHTFGGRRNASGAIFLDYRDPPDFSGRAKIYGHNMRDGSMFSSLRAWEGDTFFIHTPRGDVMEFTVTFRDVLPLRDIVAIRDDVALITCVNGRPEIGRAHV